jgi:thiamine biosynthesis lipoprotein
MKRFRGSEAADWPRRCRPAPPRCARPSPSRQETFVTAQQADTGAAQADGAGLEWCRSPIRTNCAPAKKARALPARRQAAAEPSRSAWCRAACATAARRRDAPDHRRQGRSQLQLPAPNMYWLSAAYPAESAPQRPGASHGDAAPLQLLGHARDPAGVKRSACAVLLHASLEIDPIPPVRRQAACTRCGISMGTSWSARLMAAPGPRAQQSGRSCSASSTDRRRDEPLGSRTRLLARYNRAPAGSWHALPPRFFDVLDYALRGARPAAPTIRAPARWSTCGASAPPAATTRPASTRRSGRGGRRAGAAPAARSRRLDRAGAALPAAGRRQLDLSSVAKGYAVDRLALVPGSARRAPLPGRSRRRAARRRRQAGRPAVVGRRWKACRPRLLAAPTVVALHGLAVATSGDYRRYFELTAAPARFAHARSAHRHPIANDVASVTVLHPTCMAADALSTALTVLGVDAGLAFRRSGAAWPRASSCATAACAKSIRPPGARCCNDDDRRTAALGRRAAAVRQLPGLCAAHAASAAARRAKAAAHRPDWLVVYASQTGSAEFLAGAAPPCCHRRPGGARRLHLECSTSQLRAPSASCSSSAPTAKATRPTPPRAFRRPPDGPRRRPVATCTTPCWRWATAATPISAASAARWTPGCEGAAPRRCSSASTSTAATPKRWKAGSSTSAAWPAPTTRRTGSAPAYADWRIAERELLNPAARARRLYRLRWRPRTARCRPGKPATSPRSAAPADPSPARIFDRLDSFRRPAGAAGAPAAARRRQPGAASGWLCEQALRGDDAPAAARASRFRLGDNAQRPLILIGNGSGLAGLRGLLRARASQGGRDNWLLFGERNAARLPAARRAGGWQRDRLAGKAGPGVFARPGRAPATCRIACRAGRCGARMDRRGAAIYVCGSLEGMAYRRDVY